MARHRIWLCLLIGIFVLGITTQAIAASEENQQVTSKFKDVSASDSNTVFINYVSQRGLLNGFPDGTYHPAEGLTRAQAAVIMTKAGGLLLGNSSNPFKDVDAGHWAVPYISAATKAGYISGFPDGTFHPDEKLTRAQAMAMMMRLCTVKTTDQLPVLEDMDSRHWAAGAMASALASGMTGTSADGKKAYPDAQLSRAGLARALAILLTKDPGLYKTPLYGKVQDISGSVTLVRNGTETILVNEIVLTEGDTLRTGDDGSARINYPDGSSTLMDANSEIYVKSSVGRSYIKKNGEPGTAVELLNVELKQGTLFGALATKHETENKIREQAGRASSRMAALPSFKYLAASDQATPWYRTAQTKKVKIKVDMPWGVAAVRGTFVKVTVNQDGTCRVSCLTGDAEVSGNGNNVALGQGQSSSISGAGQVPRQPGALNPDDKAAFDQVQSWVLQTAINMDTNQEVQNSQAVVEMTIEIPDNTPPESTAQVVIDALESSGIEIDSNVMQQLQGQLEGLISVEDSESTPASPGDGGRGGGNGGNTITSLTYSAAGTYGSNNAASPTVVSGNVDILVTGVTLQNMVIKGNLVLSAGIGDGNAALNNVTVNGLTLVYGGGANSVVLTNCDLYSVIIDRENNLVRIVAKGSTVVDSLVLNSSAKLEESNLSGEGFSNVASGLNLPAGAQVILSGNFSSLEINSPGISIELQGGSIETIDVGSAATGCNIALAEGTCVSSLEVNAAMTVSGTGSIAEAVINADDVVMEQTPASVTVAPGFVASIGGEEIVGQVVVSGLVNGSSGALAGVMVAAYQQQQTEGQPIEVLISQTTTGRNGRFTLDLTGNQTYILEFSRDSYVTRTINITVVASGTQTLDTVTLAAEQATVGSISGQIVDATTNVGVARVQLDLRTGLNNSTGEIIATAMSDDNGSYSFSDLAAGVYTVQLTASGYTTTYFSVTCIAGQTTGGQNGVITQTIPEGQTRIVLTWGTAPRDLDSHLTGPTSSQGPFHIYYGNPAYSEGDVTMAQLDRDDVDGYGPETTTIYAQLVGTYTFTVHNFSQEETLGNSAAQVAVYHGDGLIVTLTVPTGYTDSDWQVFTISGNTLTSGEQTWNLGDSPASSAKDITAFSLLEQTGEGTINTADHTILVTVPYGTAVTALVPTFTLSTGASAAIGETPQVSGQSVIDFTDPVTYTITATDSSTQDWTVTVAVAANNASDITAFSLPEQSGDATIDADNHTVSITVPFETAVTALVPTFTLSAGASAAIGETPQVSGQSAVDFTDPLTYTITAADSSTTDWTVTVTVMGQ